MRADRAKKGVTIIELVMVIVIVGVLASVASLYIKETIDLWRFLTYRSEVVAQGRMALMRMGREIRQVRDKNSITTADLSQFRFTDRGSVDIRYWLSGNNLMREASNDGYTYRVLAAGVSNLVFCYFDSDSLSACAPTAACACSPVADTTVIFRIVIKMDISAGSETKHIESQVYPRNLTQ